MDPKDQDEQLAQTIPKQVPDGVDPLVVKKRAEMSANAIKTMMVVQLILSVFLKGALDDLWGLSACVWLDTSWRQAALCQRTGRQVRLYAGLALCHPVSPAVPPASLFLSCVLPRLPPALTSSWRSIRTRIRTLVRMHRACSQSPAHTVKRSIVRPHSHWHTGHLPTSHRADRHAG